MIKEVLELNKILDFLLKRNLLNQYKKVKNFILSGNYKNVDLKLRKPKELGIYYFRINKQFRAWARKD